MADLIGLKISPLYSDMSIGYALDQTRLIALKVLKPVTVAQRSGKWLSWGRENMLRINTKRAPGTIAQQRGQSVSATSYYCEEYAFRDRVLWADMEEIPGLDPKVGSTLYTTEKVLLDLEYVVATLLGTSSNYATGYSTTLSGTSQWSDRSSGISTPLVDCSTARQVVRQAIGRKPNTCIIGDSAYQSLRLHDDVKKLSMYTLPGPVPDSLMPAILEVKNILVGEIAYNTAKQGATEVLADLWGDFCIFGWVPEGEPQKGEPCIGVTFRQKDFYIREYDEEAEKATYVEAETVVDPAVTALDSSSKLIGAYGIFDVNA